MNRMNKLLAGTAAAGAVLGAYAYLVEPRWLEITHPRIHLRHLPPGLEGLRIALLTDLHSGMGASLSVIRRACRAAMQARPDLIAVAGDLAADDSHSFREVLAALSSLDAPLGVFAVPGNHDYIVGIEKWHREIGAQPRLQDLTNRAVLKEYGGARICIAGVDDYMLGKPSLESLPPPDQRDLTILLAHNPDQGERSRRDYDEVDLILSGHTHAGQVRLPWIGALEMPVENPDLYEEGLRRRPWTQVYTSRGVGTTGLPVRFLCRPELPILTLTSAPRPGR